MNATYFKSTHYGTTLYKETHNILYNVTLTTEIDHSQIRVAIATYTKVPLNTANYPTTVE